MTFPTRLADQMRIQARYPALIRRYTDELCRTCAFSKLGFEGCGKGLLPVTRDGGRCPYHAKPTGTRRRRIYSGVLLR